MPILAVEVWELEPFSTTVNIAYSCSLFDRELSLISHLLEKLFDRWSLPSLYTAKLWSFMVLSCCRVVFRSTVLKIRSNGRCGGGGVCRNKVTAVEVIFMI
jgi:hypothetical protein